jgi:hypothetical protein
MTHIDPFEHSEHVFSEAHIDCRLDQDSKSPTSPNRLRRLGSRLALSAICIMPVADLALSDAANIKILQAAHDTVHEGSALAQRGIENGIVGAAIFTEAMVLAYPVTRMRRLQGVVDGFGEYQEMRQSQMGPARAAVSKLVNAPFMALGWVGEKAESVGNNKGSKLLVDLGQVNAIGTTAVAMQETIESDRPVTTKRLARLSGLITVSWIATAEAVRGVYEGAGRLGPPGKLVQTGMDGLGRGLEVATNLDPTHPQSTPISAVILGSIAAGLAATGWNVAKFHEQKGEQLSPSPDEDLVMEDVARVPKLATSQD